MLVWYSLITLTLFQLCFVTSYTVKAIKIIPAYFDLPNNRAANFVIFFWKKTPTQPY